MAKVEKIKDLKVETVITDAFNIFKNNFVMLVISALIVALGSIFIITIAPLSYGFFMLCHKLVKKEKAEVKDVFEGFNYFFRSWSIFLLTFILVVIGVIAFIIPGIVVAFLLIYTIPISIIKNMGVTDSMSASYNIAKNNLLFTVILTLVTFGINAVGGFIPFFNLITTPLTVIMIMIATKELEDK
ncbi:MAG: glycerophosphodiester phosphodiesterase [DPANN group archaeon]|nr:glycerophosphodiester phosphodiesterase [DPANN group archaeon]